MGVPNTQVEEPVLIDGAYEDFPNPDRDMSKRKREDDEQLVTNVQSKRAAKKRKKAKARGAVDDVDLDLGLQINHAIAHMDSQLMADHIAQGTKRFQPDASAVEPEDSHIPADAILDTSSWDKPRTSNNLPDFLEHFASVRTDKKRNGLSVAAEENGHPHTLVVTSAGQRAADLTRHLKKFRTKDAMVAKLFAKHIKLGEAVKMVRSTRMGIGVGTPQRLCDLFDSGALSPSKLERIVVDASHIDQKKRGILDMKDTHTQLVYLLRRPDLKERCRAIASDRRIELLFF